MKRVAIIIMIGILVISGIQGGTALVIKNLENKMHEENKYEDDMTELFIVAGNAINEIKDLTAESKYTDEWTTQVKKNLSLIQQASGEASALVPPKSLNEIHDIYLSAFEKFKLGTNKVSSGIKSNDERLISNGVDLFNEGMREFMSGSERATAGS